MNFSYCQSADYLEVQSMLTQRTLFINLSAEKILIAPNFNVDAMRTSVHEFLLYNKGDITRSMQLGGRLLHCVRALQAAQDATEFASALDELLTAASIRFAKARDLNRRDQTRGNGRISHLLGRLWIAGCVAWPSAGQVFGRTNLARLDFWETEIARSIVENIIEPFQRLNKVATGARNRRNTTPPSRQRILMEVLLSTIGVAELGDLTPDVVGKRLVEFQARRGHASAVAHFLCTLIKSEYKDAPRIIARDYVPLFSKGHRSDTTFKWAVNRDQSLEDWRALAEQFLYTKKHGYAGMRTVLNAFFEALLSDPSLPRQPIELLRVGPIVTQLPDLFKASNVDTKLVNQRRLSSFFDYVLDTMCVEEGDDGLPYRIPGFRNPIQANGARVTKGETLREVLPTRYVSIMIEILEENDFEWARTIDSDYFNWQDPGSGQWSRIWSPVRCDAIRAKLRLPLRTFQVRVLNSGETDPEKYDIRTAAWIPNPHPLAAHKDRPNPFRGVLKRIWDHKNGKDFVGLFINTNKTRDLHTSPRDRGYTIPWHYAEAIEIFSNLRDWQEKYNPVNAPLAWIDITEKIIGKGYHRDVLQARGAETFLFRDPASLRPAEPVWQGRLQAFWLRLCDELERRLRLLGETGPDGQPITLVKRDPTGRITSCIYDLHGLRVALLTAWGEVGVPVEVLMKVAGHCTAIMTIYYQKYSISHITDVLNAAQLERIQAEQTNFERHIRARAIEELEAFVASNDPSTLSLLASGSGSSWIRSDIGVCPVGGNRCGDGGDLIGGKGESARYAPVRGGARNCVGCRFFITGPPFLIGLQAHFNSIGLRYQIASRKYTEAERTYFEMNAERRSCELSGQVFLKTKKWQIASATYEQYLRELDDVIFTWNAARRLIEDSEAILRSDRTTDSDSKFALVVNGPLSQLEFVLEVDEMGERDFELLDQICQSAVWFESIDAGVANLKRMRRFDAFLQRNGESAVFCEMDEDDALRAGNQLAKFMYSQFPREDVNALMSGRKTLAAMGIDAQSRVINAAKEISITAARRQNHLPDRIERDGR